MSPSEGKHGDRGNPSPSQRKRDVPVVVPDAPDADALAPVTVEEVRDRRRSLSMLLVAVGVLIAVGIPSYGVWSILLRPQTRIAEGRPVQIEIPAGSDTRAIAEILASEGVIDNSVMFRLRTRVQGVDGDLRPGIYEFETGMEFSAVTEALLAGPTLEYTTVTIPEGFTVEQIAERMETDAGIPAAEFSALALEQATDFAEEYPFLEGITTGSLEGYLFPKTYRIPEGATATDVIGIMLRQFEREIALVDLSDSAKKNLTPHDVVIIASMIEREARVAEERPLVSSVIYNRLSRGMRLEIDATIEYILPGTRPRLLYRHLEIDSPYNTYMYGGLPVGPIASPGLASLEAAAHPADTEYLYYVLTGTDGSHTFTTNETDFLKAKEKSREVVP